MELGLLLDSCIASLEYGFYEINRHGLGWNFKVENGQI